MITDVTYYPPNSSRPKLSQKVDNRDPVCLASARDRRTGRVWHCSLLPDHEQEGIKHHEAGALSEQRVVASWGERAS